MSLKKSTRLLAQDNHISASGKGLPKRTKFSRKKTEESKVQQIISLKKWLPQEALCVENSFLLVYLVLFISIYLFFIAAHFSLFQTALALFLSFSLFFITFFRNRCLILQTLINFTGMILGAIIFLSIFNVSLLNTNVDDWLLVQVTEGDMKIAYSGWLAYRQESFQFPPGKLISIGYPQTSIVFTDSIPLIALLIKPLAGILPTPFQYFGLWILACYLLMGHFSFKLLTLFSKKIHFLIPASLFFILSPVLAQRFLINHFALMGHFLIVFAFYLFFKKREDKDILKWVLLISISLLIHLYLYAMVFLIFLFYYLAICKRKKMLRYAIYFLLILLLQLFIAYIAGYFVGESIEVGRTINPEFGTCASDINSLVNPLGYSKFFDALPTRTLNRDIFNYLGLSVIVAFIISILFLIKNSFDGKILKKWIWLIAPTLLLALFSLSHEISCNKMTILNYNIPSILALLTQFGASCRFLWPCYYLVLVFIFYTFSRFKNTRAISSIIVVLLILQLYELSSIYAETIQIATYDYSYENPLEDPIWNEISKDKHELALIEVDVNSQVSKDFAIVAIKNKLNIGNVRLARFTKEQDTLVKKRVLEFFSGNLQAGVIYVSTEDKFERARPRLEGLNYTTFWVDEFVLVYKNP